MVYVLGFTPGMPNKTLTKTDEMLSLHGISSISELEEKLYEDISEARTVDVLDRAVSEIFSYVPKSLAFVFAGNGMSDYAIKVEEKMVLGLEEKLAELPLHHSSLRRLSGSPAFVRPQQSHEKRRPVVFYKTILGETVGDIFAVQGVRAGADPELDLPVYKILGTAQHSGEMSTPFRNLMMLRWANRASYDSSAARFIKEMKLAENSNVTYVCIVLTVDRSARLLRDKGIILYRGRNPSQENGYLSTGKDPIPSRPPYYGAMGAVTAIIGAISNEIRTIDEICAKTHYSKGYVRAILNSLLKDGYAEIGIGMPRKRPSEMSGTRNSVRLCGYVDSVMKMFGLQKNGDLWSRPKIDAAGLLDYRREVIDRACADETTRAEFTGACRTAYDRHMSYARKGRRTDNSTHHNDVSF